MLSHTPRSTTCSPQEKSAGSPSALASSTAVSDAIAQLSQELREERANGAALAGDIAGLKEEMCTLHEVLSQVSQQLLGGHTEAALEAVRQDLLAQQEQQDVQAAALREGLMDIQQQRSAVKALTEKATDAEDDGGRGWSVAAATLRAEVSDMRASLEEREELACEVSELRALVQKFAEQPDPKKRPDVSQEQVARIVKTMEQGFEQMASRNDISRLAEEMENLRSNSELQIADVVSECSGCKTKVEAVSNLLSGQVDDVAVRHGFLEAKITAEVARLAAALEAAPWKAAGGEEARGGARADVSRLVEEVLSVKVQMEAALQESCAARSEDRLAEVADALQTLQMAVRRIDADLAGLWAAKDEAAEQTRVETCEEEVREQVASLHRYVAVAETRDAALRKELEEAVRLGQEARGALGQLPGLASRLDAVEAWQGEPRELREKALRPAGRVSPARVPRPEAEAEAADGAALGQQALRSSSPGRRDALAAGTPSPGRSEDVPCSEAKSSRGTVHSVPAALHGLAAPARPLPPNASRRKALIVACSYYESHAPLLGSLNDAWNVLSLLRHTLQYAEDQVRFVVDGSKSCSVSNRPPTRANILEGLQWLTADAQPDDELFFFFSGYGTQCGVGPDQEGHLVPIDFADGLPAEVLALHGLRATGAAEPAAPGQAHAAYRLVPLREISLALAVLPKACKVTVVLDCCHALVPGVAGAPPSFPRVAMEPASFPGTASQAASPLFVPRPRYLDLPPLEAGQAAAGAADPGQVPEPSCRVHCFSACKAHQWCAELPIEGVMQGAFTWAWVKALIAGHLDPPVRQLSAALKTILLDLQHHFHWMNQEPVVQLSAGAKLHEGRDDKGTKQHIGMPQRPLPINHQRRKALLVGINYTGSHAQLKGCVNDAWNVHCLLRHTLQFGEDQIRLLIDGENGQATKQSRDPTRANILAGLQWLVKGAQPGDCLVLLFCGYGAQHPQAPGSDAYEAYLVPADFSADLPPGAFDRAGRGPAATPEPKAHAAQDAASAGYRLVSLLELNRFVAQLPAKASLTMILDCSYPVVPGLSPANNQPVAFPKVQRGRVDYRKLHDFVSRPRFLELPPLPVRHTPSHLRVPVFPECLVHCFSACSLQEWDAELPLEGTVQGTFTWALTKAFAAGRFKCSVAQLQEHLAKITADLRKHFKGVEQTPMLTLSRSAGMNDTVLAPVLSV